MNNELDLKTDVIPEAPAPGESLAAAIEHRAAKRNKPLKVKPSRFAGLVIVECRRLTAGRMAKTSEIRAPWMQAADVLVHCAVDVILVNPETGEQSRPGCKIDGVLADMFESVIGDTQHEIARSLFANDVELMTIAKRVIDWSAGKELEDVAEEAIDELAGEADAAT